MFNMLSISNEQTYSFAALANSFLFTMLALMVVVWVSYITRSPRPEKAFVSLVSRFFRACEFLLSTLESPEPPKSLIGRWKWDFYLREVRGLPPKILQWGSQLSSKKFSGMTPEKVAELGSDLDVMGHRIEDLVVARFQSHSEYLAQELTSDIREWRVAIQECCHGFSADPGSLSVDELSGRLRERMGALSDRIENVLNTTAGGEIEEGERLKFYQLIGSFLRFSEAGLVYARGAGAINWDNLREERF